MIDVDKETRDFNKFLNEFNLSTQPVNHFANKSTDDLLHFVEKQQKCIAKMQVIMEELQNYSTTLGDIRQAKVVLEHWKRFNEFLEANPDYKQEWDSLCMAMRLQES